MAPQFARIQGYSVKPKKGSGSRSIAAIVGEAMRTGSYCGHLKKLGQPQILFGDPASLLSEAHALVKSGKSQVTTNGKSSFRKLHRSAPVVSGGILSYPRPVFLLKQDVSEVPDRKPDDQEPTAPFAESVQEVAKWIAVSLQWMKQKYGPCLHSLIAHFDESHPHLHFFLLAQKLHNEVVDLNAINPGRAAKEAARRTHIPGETPAKSAARQRAAGCRALSAWQDDYHHHVASHCNQSRFGDRRSRLSSRVLKAWKIKNANKQLATPAPRTKRDAPPTQKIGPRGPGAAETSRLTTRQPASGNFDVSTEREPDTSRPKARSR